MQMEQGMLFPSRRAIRAANSLATRAEKQQGGQQAAPADRSEAVAATG